MESRPVGPFVVSLSGGLFILAGGILGLFIFGSSGFEILTAFAVACGVIVTVGSTMIYTRPDRRIGWGIIIILFSIASILTLTRGLFGGFGIGLILGVVGGARAIAWVPGAAPPR